MNSAIAGSAHPGDMAEAMKLAEMMAGAKLVPPALQKSPADCLMVIQQAIRWDMDPFAVAQECSVIQGKLMHSGKLVAAVVNARGLDDFVTRSNRYSTLAAAELNKRGARVGLADLALRPLGRFVSMYFLRGGFLDGWRGFVLAVLYANYVFLRTAKAWEARSGQSERDRTTP